MPARAEDRQAESRIEHVLSADVSSKLDRVAGSGLVERGSVVMIGLDAIKQSFADRWPRRREQIIEHAERTMRERLDESDLFVRVSETSHLLCLASKSGIAAHALAVRILEDIVVFFLGKCATNNLVVETVRAIDGASIVAERMNLAELAKLRAESAEAAFDDIAVSDAPAPAPEHDAIRPPAANLPHAAAPQSDLRLACELEAIVNLRDRQVAAARIAPRFTDTRTGQSLQLSNLAGWSSVRLITAEHQIIDWASEAAGAQPPSARRGLILPITIQSLSTSRGRTELIARLDALPIGLRRRLVIELLGIVAGTPTSHLHEAVGFLRSKSRAVIARPLLSKPILAALKSARVDGVAAEASDLGKDNRQIASNMITFASAVNAMAAMSLVTGVTSEILADCAEAAGVSHIGVREQDSSKFCVQDESQPPVDICAD